MYEVPRRGEPLVVAHRGGADLAAENSWEAFENCARLGFQYVETDAHLSADGKVVLIHDPVLDRVSDSSGSVRDLSAKQLQQVKIINSAFGAVLLEDVLTAFPKMLLNIDVKEEDVWEPVVDVVKNLDAGDRVLIASFDAQRLERVRSYAPEIQASLGKKEVIDLLVCAQLGVRPPAKLQSWPSRGIVAAQVPLNVGPLPVVTKRFVSYAHTIGIAVHVWTLNEPDQIARALDAGADAVISDHPLLVREMIAARYQG